MYTFYQKLFNIVNIGQIGQKFNTVCNVLINSLLYSEQNTEVRLECRIQRLENLSAAILHPFHSASIPKSYDNIVFVLLLPWRIICQLYDSFDIWQNFFKLFFRSFWKQWRVSVLCLRLSFQTSVFHRITLFVDKIDQWYNATDAKLYISSCITNVKFSYFQ